MVSKRPDLSHRRYRERRQALRKEGNECFWCLETIDYALTGHDPGAFVADHLNPVANGGEGVHGAIVASHWQCNNVRGTKPGYQGMYAGRRPQPRNPDGPPIPGSKQDPNVWPKDGYPVRDHTIYTESRCKRCPCRVSAYWLGSYELHLPWAQRDVEAVEGGYRFG